MTSPAGGPRVSDDDLFVLLILAVLASGGVLAAAVACWSRALAWLLEHQVLIVGSRHPLVALPGSGGAGLDLPRLSVAAAVLLLLGAVTVSVFRRHRHTGDVR